MKGYGMGEGGREGGREGGKETEEKRLIAEREARQLISQRGLRI